ncbi:uncharacterized protein LOC130746555 [Lotus japonicus]|uniref:uncharacterized protein LOC130746555 n=1 Tax=Lotus japonicus TaxID=34305 RepID=UPI002582F3B2|nr:uncharacterized protein LOC130746555 [Lotus japonicus]XP_057455209.1 uncharacterized protein LOC130746555 [Lotus japonicus]
MGGAYLVVALARFPFYGSSGSRAHDVGGHFSPRKKEGHAEQRQFRKEVLSDPPSKSWCDVLLGRKSESNSAPTVTVTTKDCIFEDHYSQDELCSISHDIYIFPELSLGACWKEDGKLLLDKDEEFTEVGKKGNLSKAFVGGVALIPLVYRVDVEFGVKAFVFCNGNLLFNLKLSTILGGWVFDLFVRGEIEELFSMFSLHVPRSMRLLIVSSASSLSSTEASFVSIEPHTCNKQAEVSSLSSAIVIPGENHGVEVEGSLDGMSREPKKLWPAYVVGGHVNSEELARLNLIRVVNSEGVESVNCLGHSLDDMDFFSSSIPFGLDETIHCLMDHPSFSGAKNALGETPLGKDAKSFNGLETSGSNRLCRGRDAPKKIKQRRKPQVAIALDPQYQFGVLTCARKAKLLAQGLGVVF